jgi:hypothetical protein
MKRFDQIVDRLKVAGIFNPVAFMHVENGMLPFGGGRDGRRHMTPLECLEAGGEYDRALEDLITNLEQRYK